MKETMQKILFGSPGTGKSYKVNTEYLKTLNIKEGSPNHIPVVFHPEYTYGDFMGKLMPLSKSREGEQKVEYNYYTGHFLKALGRAYKNIITTHLEWEMEKKELWEAFRKQYPELTKRTLSESQNSTIRAEYEKLEGQIKKNNPQEVLLLIDEINRGNSSAIFGTVFQLLDREKSGWPSRNWSAYSVTLSDLEHLGLEKEIGFEQEKKFDKKWYHDTTFDGKSIPAERYKDLQKYIFSDLETKNLLAERKIKLPPNLHIVATMNTSDNSIYFMDNSFKRRWDWEFVPPDFSEATWQQLPTSKRERKLTIYGEEIGYWYQFKANLNDFIRSQHETIRKIDDKQIGYFFIDEDQITEYHIKSKLLFYLWDSVFPNNKRPLVELLWGKEKASSHKHKLVSFGQFSSEENVKTFVDAIWHIDAEKND